MAGGNASSEWFGGVRSRGVALFTFAVVVFLNNFTRGIWKLGSLLFGMIAGYVAAYFAGIVDLSGVADAQWASLPRFMPFEIEFVPSAVVSQAIVYIVNSVQTIGDLSSTTMGGMDRLPTDQELSGGIVAQGLVSIVGALFGGLPAATYSQNVGIVTVNRVINKAVFAFAALVLLAAGLVPKFAAVLTTIPQAVIGAPAGLYLKSEHGLFLAQKLWSEVAAVAAVKGIHLAEDVLIFPGQSTSARYSTLQDLEAGRHTEIDMFAGHMLRMAEKAGISVPYCEYTFHAIKAMEEKNDGLFD